MASLLPPGARPPPLRDDEDELPEPPRLRALRRLVSLLTMTAILGVAVVAGTLAIRLSKPLTPPLDLDALTARRLVAPEGEAIVAAGTGPGVVILATRDGAGVERLRFYDAGDGALRRTLEIDRGAP